jgi:hypothetical protein
VVLVRLLVSSRLLTAVPRSLGALQCPFCSRLSVAGPGCHCPLVFTVPCLLCPVPVTPRRTVSLLRSTALYVAVQASAALSLRCTPLPLLPAQAAPFRWRFPLRCFPAHASQRSVPVASSGSQLLRAVLTLNTQSPVSQCVRQLSTHLTGTKNSVPCLLYQGIAPSPPLSISVTPLPLRTTQ